MSRILGEAGAENGGTFDEEMFVQYMGLLGMLEFKRCSWVCADERVRGTLVLQTQRGLCAFYDSVQSPYVCCC